MEIRPSNLRSDNALFVVPGAELRLNGKLIHYRKPEPDAPPSCGRIAAGA
jgi:hypothetical protein